MTITSWRMLKRFIADNLVPYGNAQLKDIARAVDDLADTTEASATTDGARTLLHDTGTITIAGHTGTVSTITSWGSLAAIYSKLEFQSIGATNNIRASEIITTADWVDNTQVIPYVSPSHSFSVTDMDIAGNTFDLSEVGTAFNTGRLLIYGIV